MGGGASYNNPASLLNLTRGIVVDILFNAYQRDLPRKVDFVDEVERTLKMSDSKLTLKTKSKEK